MKKIQNFLNSKFGEILIIIFILIAGFVVRLYHLNSPLADWHSWRQADTASVARIYLDKGIDLLHPRYYDISKIQTGAYNPEGYRMVEFPIRDALHAILAKNFTFVGFEAWGRLISIFCALISAFFLYLIAKHYSGKWTGLTAAFIFLFIPYNIYFSRVILPEPMAVMFGVISLYLFVKEKYIFSAVFLALGSLLKPFVFFYGLPMLYLAIDKYGFSGIFKKKILIVFADIALIPFFLWRIWVNGYPNGIPHFDWAFNGDHIRFRPAFWYWIFGERIGRLILGVWGVVPLSIALIKTEKKNLFSFFFLFGVVLYTITIATANVRHDYYQIFLVPALALMVAEGLRHLWVEKTFNHVISRPFSIFVVFLMLMIGYFQVKEYYKINHTEIIEAGQALDKIAPKDAIVIAPYNGDTAFLYQTKRFGFPVVDEAIEDMVSKRGASYFVTVNYADPDTKYVMDHFKVLEKTNTYMIADLTKKAK
ncbi:MAG: glycosyltransferase family 39 protein [Patescibacteria group bacterium]